MAYDLGKVGISIPLRLDGLVGDGLTNDTAWDYFSHQFRR